MKCITSLLCLIFLVLSVAGCPDRSYMKPVPDYSKQTDPDNDVTDERAQAESGAKSSPSKSASDDDEGARSDE